MSRNGSGVYSKPSGTTPVDGDDIDAAPYNTLMDDIATDLNTPRPIVAGGTGSSSAAAALTALGAMAKSANLYDVANAATARANLGVVPQTSATDATANSLLAVGAFGLGQDETAPLLSSLNATDTAAGLYRYSSSSTGTKPAGIAADGSILVVRGKNSTSLTQHLWSEDGAVMYFRGCDDSTFSDWSAHYGKASTGEAEAGTSDVKYMTPKTTKEAIDEHRPEPFTSAEQTVTANSKLTIAHGLGAVPGDVTCHMVCKTADSPYAVGEVMLTPTASQIGASEYGCSITWNSTNVIIRTGTQIPANTDAGAAKNLTLANWRFVVKAWPA